MELDRIKKELKKANIRNKKSKFGLWIYTKYTTFFISNDDLNLKYSKSKELNDFILDTVLNL